MQSNKAFNGALVFIYLAVRFGCIRFLDGISNYASYAFEAAFVAVCIAIHRKKFRLFSKKALPLLAGELVASSLLGVAVYHFSKRLDLIVPFDFSQTETVLFMLLIGPVLEELLFRQALWHSLGAVLKDPRQVLAATAGLFAFAHFCAYFFMPEPLQPFVLYQTAYTFAMALWWGFSFQKREEALAVPLVLHLGFNAGFYLGFRALGII